MRLQPRAICPPRGASMCNILCSERAACMEPKVHQLTSKPKLHGWTGTPAVNPANWSVYASVRLQPEAINHRCAACGLVILPIHQPREPAVTQLTCKPKPHGSACKRTQCWTLHPSTSTCACSLHCPVPFEAPAAACETSACMEPKVHQLTSKPKLHG